MSVGIEDLTQAFGAAVTPLSPSRIGIAVSGGGDSVALLHAAVGWAARSGLRVSAVTVDHGLRDASATEAADVAGLCAALGVDHTILRWTDRDPTGNLQDQARRARYALMTDWAKDRGIRCIALGHTATDQAETVLMRLGRGSGVDGLSGMAPQVRRGGVDWIRPFLSIERQPLRDALAQCRATWVDDPSNEDTRFDRIKVRQALVVLDALGITVQGLTQTAARMGTARQALEQQTHQAATGIARLEDGDVVLHRGPFLALPTEINRRLLSHALCWVATADYGPREAGLTNLRCAIAEGRSFALHGCLCVVSATDVRITREWNAVRDLATAPDQVWDGRWALSGPQRPGDTVRALGEAGLAQCPDWRQTGRKRISLLASPAIWNGATLVAAPLAGNAGKWAAELTFGPTHFFLSILSH